ncbi:efflux transporter outer membrane subunit [Caulobacter rhizosphaerae]|uniref:efflux transporter outer membrane subunit n=1 Tax=Caulobacter rhizosphaerae TaxID=2010972 RepID=UPI0013D09DEF|nr:efflux transporter outer membrane subunit [Caulobacter rhizosphaerae]
MAPSPIVSRPAPTDRTDPRRCVRADRRVLVPLSAAALTLLLGACAVGPDYVAPSRAKLGAEGPYVMGPQTPTGDIARWWTGLNDPVLDGLVERALADNLDIGVSLTRLRQAREALVQAQAGRLPTLSATASYNRALLDAVGAANTGSLGLDAGYDPGLFGTRRRGEEAAASDYAAVGLDLASARRAIAAETARNYVLARQAQANLAIARGALGIQADNLEIAGFRGQAGLVSGLDLEQARAQRAQTAASIPAFEQGYRSALNRLAVLTGQAPGAIDRELAAPGSIPRGPDVVAVGVPADVLRQRPDVRAAERRLASASARIGVAQAQLYPALTLSGDVATAATSIRGLGDVVTGRIFASLGQSLFDGGVRRSRLRVQQAAADEALLAYKQTVLGALEDVGNGMAALDASLSRETELSRALDAATIAATLARGQYRVGLTDITTLNVNEASLLSAQTGLSNARAEHALAVIQLYLALGGGWDGAVPQASARP